jgi:hypothetical protein
MTAGQRTPAAAWPPVTAVILGPCQRQHPLAARNALHLAMRGHIYCGTDTNVGRNEAKLITLSDMRWSRGMNALVRILICAVIGLIAVSATAWIQSAYGNHSTARLGGVGMIAIVLAWTFTGMKLRS